MRRADREGYCSVHMIDGSGRYLLTREHYEPVRTAWMRGEAFYTGRDCFGSPITIKLGRVESVCDVPADVCAAALEDEEQNRKDRAITGDA